MSVSYACHGKGDIPVIIVHDWFCDVSEYDFMKAVLTNDATFCFTDMRGYGKSQHLKGAHTLEEAAWDILSVADQLGWDKFHFIGHSMSGMLALYLAATQEARLLSCIAIAPVAPCGLPGVDDETFKFLQSAATSDKEAALQVASMMSGNRLSPEWAEFKVQNWWKTSTPEARVGYLEMFVKSNFESDIDQPQVPILVLCGQYDSENHQLTYLEQQLSSHYENIEIEEIKNSAHYPMQEVPGYTARRINDWILNQE